MNILEISISATYGGGPEHIYLLEKYIDKSKFSIYTACPFQEPYYNRFKELSEVCIEIPYRKFSLKSFIKLLKFTKINGINLIHCHGKGAGIYGRLITIFTGSPSIYTLHGISYGGISKIKKCVYFIIERLLNKITKKIINVSYSERDLGVSLKLYNKEKAIVIPNGIEVDRYKNTSTISKSYLNLKKEDFIIGNISRLCYQKGLPFLIQAFRIVDIPNKKLVIVGDGEDRAELENLVKQLELDDDVIFLGMRQDVQDIIKLFDIYVTSSRWEGLPISLIEVMASGIPIVASDVTGNNELIIDKYNGILCGAKDYRDIADKIMELYNSDKKNYYIQNSKKAVEEKYSINKMVADIEQLYSIYAK